MFKNKKAQVGNIVGNLVITIVLSVFVFGVLYGLTPVIIDFTGPIVANPEAGIFLRVLCFGLAPFAWCIWLFGTVYYFRKAIDGEEVSIFGQ